MRRWFYYGLLSYGSPAAPYGAYVEYVLLASAPEWMVPQSDSIVAGFAKVSKQAPRYQVPGEPPVMSFNELGRRLWDFDQGRWVGSWVELSYLLY